MARREEWVPLFEAVTAAGWRMRRVRHGVLCLPHKRGVRPAATRRPPRMTPANLIRQSPAASTAAIPRPLS